MRVFVLLVSIAFPYLLCAHPTHPIRSPFLFMAGEGALSGVCHIRTEPRSVSETT